MTPFKTPAHVVAAAMLLFGVLVAPTIAQDFFFSNFQWGYQSLVIGDVSQECGGTWNLKSASMAEYDTSAWVSILCADGTLHARRYYHPNDNTRRGLKQPTLTPVPTEPTPTPYGNDGRVQVKSCNSTDHNYYGTGVTECEWKRRWGQQ